MADIYLNQFLAKGTAAARAAFTPDPPSPDTGPVHAYLWWETDTYQLWAWDGSAWHYVAVNWPDDVRQTFNPGTNNAGLNVGALSGNPSSPSNGDLWYDSSANALK